MGASREGILAIDTIIKRWIAYDEAASVQPQPQPPCAPVPQQRPGLQRKTAAAGGVKMHDKARPAGATVAAGPLVVRIVAWRRLQFQMDQPLDAVRVGRFPRHCARRPLQWA